MKEFALITLFLISTTIMAQKSFHDFTVKDIDGNQVSMSKFKGKKVLVVNVASKCGYTPQYEGLQELYKTYGDEEFVIIGFPANNFLWQEPGSDSEIKQFCSNKYNVTFPMMSKISVKGSAQSELYSWLTKMSENGVKDAKVTWNFQKFLIGEEGEWLVFFEPKTTPMSEEIVNWLK